LKDKETTELFSDVVCSRCDVAQLPTVVFPLDTQPERQSQLFLPSIQLSAFGYCLLGRLFRDRFAVFLTDFGLRGFNRFSADS